MVKKVKALFEFCFQVGDVITVLNQEDAGWWEGELNGVKGLFPSNYVETVPDTMVSPTALPVGGRAGPPPINNNANGGRAGGGPPPQPFGGAATTTKAGPPPIKAGAGGPPKIPVVMPAQEQKTNGGGGGGGGGRGGGGGGGDVVKAAPAASSGAPRAEKLREARTKFGPWSSNMAFYSGINMIVFGCLGFIWYSANEAEDIVSRSMTLYCSLYSFFVGIGVLVWEHFLGQKRGSSGIPARGLVYTLLSLFLFMSWPTLLPAFFLFSTAFTNFVATAMGEVYDAPPKKAAPPEKKGAEAQAEGIFGAIKVYIASISQQNKVGQTIFFAAYVVGNVALFAYKVNLWVGKVHDAKIALDDDKTKVPTGWTPVAKGFGGLLDLNCALILMPVLRTIIRYLYNRSTADQGFVSTMLRGILYFIPLDQNLKFHKLIASVIMGATIGHTIAHYVNFSLRPVAVLTSFHGAWPLVSGGLVCLAMFYIYSAVFQNTKQGQFEIFWYSHHIFVFFFLILFVHGTNGLNPGFWQFFIGPGALYLVERLLRVYRANQRVVVLSATIMDDVFSLEFAKEGALSQYKEGQYIFLNSPPISQVQWHPFTISSAPEEKTVTVHIRVSVEGSWTRELCAYISAMGPRGKPFFALDRQGPQGKLQGKVLGPDGKPMLCIDGPHSAPTQHVSEYSTAMVVGGGIGATPVSATLKSVVFHRWKYFIGQCFPDHAYFMWVCAHRDIDAFRWLIRNIKDAQDEVCHMRANSPAQMATKTFRFDVWITSVPKGQKPIDVILGEEDQIGFWGVPSAESKVEKVRASWDEADLYKQMKCPTAHTALGDVHVYEGRPQWNQRFVEIGAQHPTENIGVTFCGNPMIASDLKKQCFLHNQNRTKGFFKLHKENF